MRDWIWAPPHHTGSTESYPLDHQWSPKGYVIYVTALYLASCFLWNHSTCLCSPAYYHIQNAFPSPISSSACDILKLYSQSLFQSTPTVHQIATDLSLGECKHLCILTASSLYYFPEICLHHEDRIWCPRFSEPQYICPVPSIICTSEYTTTRWLGPGVTKGSFLAVFCLHFQRTLYIYFQKVLHVLKKKKHHYPILSVFTHLLVLTTYLS